MDKNIYSRTGLYIKFKSRNIIERVIVDDLDITELEPVDYRNELIAFYDYTLPRISDNYTVNLAYEFADEILKDNIVLGILLKADMNKYLIHGKLTEEIYTSDEIKNKLETVSVRMQILPYMKGYMNKFLYAMKNKELLTDFLKYIMPDKVEYKVVKSRSGEEILFFDEPKNYYDYLIFTFYQHEETVCECENCNRLFVPKTKKKTLYCDRVFKDGKTCKEIGPIIKHKMLAENDLVLQTFNKEKNKMYKRMERSFTFGETSKSITCDEYTAWLSTAVNAKNLYLNNQLTVNEALEMIMTD